MSYLDIAESNNHSENSTLEARRQSTLFRILNPETAVSNTS